MMTKEWRYHTRPSDHVVVVVVVVFVVVVRRVRKHTQEMSESH
jgi:hypothetical protein